MSYINYLPKPLLGDIINNQCIPIIGAGFSLNAVVSRGGKMPLWEDLGKKFASELLEYPYNNPVDAISAYCHEYSKIKLIEKLTEYIHIMDSKPGDVHTAFCSIPFDIVCTTNFDFLLERGYEKTGMYCLPIIEESQLPISNRKYDLISEVPKISLLKLHGDLNHPERIVVTEQDYDSFLDKYPLISTYLANLLITRTPIFIGYSLDDPDFRQVWQIINERLGKLCRPAYALVVNSDRATISKFDRRNVKVINIPGKRYQQVLVKLFKEIREYWIKSQDVNKTLQDQTLAELSLPVESVGRLCYFMIASKYQSFYKSYVYPIAKDYGITPISFDEAISAGDNNILAREIALIERADLIIIDIDNERQLESLQIAMEKRKKQVYLLVVHEGESYLKYTENTRNIQKPKDLFNEPGQFIQQIEEWFKYVSSDLRSKLSEEPRRLLKKKEYNAAVISAISLFENNLRRAIEQRKESCESESIRPMPLIKLISIAMELQLLPDWLKKEYKLDEWIHIRNQVVHNGLNVPHRTANEIVNGVLGIMDKLNYFNVT